MRREHEELVAVLVLVPAPGALPTMAWHSRSENLSKALCFSPSFFSLFTGIFVAVDSPPPRRKLLRLLARRRGGTRAGRPLPRPFLPSLLPLRLLLLLRILLPLPPW